MKKAVIYLRVSTILQSPERQLNDLKDYIKRFDYEVSKTFEDTISGTVAADERTGFNELLEYIKEHDIKQVFVWELSRIGRNLKHSLQVIDQLSEIGVNVTSKREGINTFNASPNDKLQLNLLLVLAEYERETILLRTVGGVYNSVRKGGVVGGGFLPYGYSNLNGYIVIDDEKADIVRDMFDKYLNKDYSLYQIADYLNEAGIKSNYMENVDNGSLKNPLGKPTGWTAGTISKLFHKTIYTGFRKHGKVEIQLDHLQIIEKSTFDAVQLKMAKKRKLQANAQVYQNIFRNTLKCGHCGASLFMHRSDSLSQNHYKCYNRFTKKDKSCASASINIDLLNNTIYEAIKDFKVNSIEVQKRIKELQKQVEKNTVSHNRLKVEADNISKEKSRLLKLFGKGLYTEAELENEASNINDRLKNQHTKIKELEELNITLQTQIKHLEVNKEIDLNNPTIFKANAADLIETITVNNITSTEGLSPVQLNDLLEYTPFIDRTARDYFYTIYVKMNDNSTFSTLVYNRMDYEQIIKVEKINPQDKNKHLSKIHK